MSAWAACRRATIDSAWRSSSAPASVRETARGPPGRSSEPLADEPFERLDLLADRGLGVAERLGRAAERALAGDRLQGREVTELDAEPAIRFHNGFEE